MSHIKTTKTNVNILDDYRSIHEVMQERYQRKLKTIAYIRKGLVNRQRILDSPGEQVFLRKHIALGLPMEYVAWRFGLTVGQAWSLIRELQII